MLNTVLIEGNMAERRGGGAFAYLSNIRCQGNCTFVANKANKTGGGIHAVCTLFELSNSRDKDLNTPPATFNFIENTANEGGAIYFETNSKLNCIVDRITLFSKIHFTANSAVKHGGAIYVRDETYLSICNSNMSTNHKAQSECFFQVMYDFKREPQPKNMTCFSFMNNSAPIGSLLYGGLLDRCKISPMSDILYYPNSRNNVSGLEYFHAKTEGSLTMDSDSIASDVVRVVHCAQDGIALDHEISAFKGQPFNVSVKAFDQVNHTLGASIRISLPEEHILGKGQQLQSISDNCTNLTYSITSPGDSVNFVLYAEEGPCENHGLSSYSIFMKFNECTCFIGFIQDNLNNCNCVLDPKLKDYVEVINQTQFKRYRNTWINYYPHGQKNEYIIHPNCPNDYCKPPDTGIFNLSERNGSDGQCAFNRKGLLCGQCKQGFSLSLGSSHCSKCPNNWPGLAIVNFLVGVINGIILVVILLFLNLTVACGTLNGVIFYANMVMINKSIFLRFPSTNVFSVFIHLLNTQLGIDRCVLEGLDSYSKTWLSYLFPLYLISLVVAIMIICKVSPKCAEIIGKRNPVATLATLILLSYAALLRTVLVTFSFTIVQYPGGKNEVVWLPDASVKYFKGKHIILFLTTMCVVTVGLTYTILLFSWQWLQRLPNVKIFRLIRSTKLNLFIEAYHASYTPKYRYWTGFLLLVRILLNIIVTGNVASKPHYNLLAMGILVTVVITLKLFMNEKLYKKKLLDYAECVCYINLLLLTTSTHYSLYDGQSHGNTSTCVSISVTFVIFICTILYHVHCTLYRGISRYKRACDVIMQRVERNSSRDDPCNNTCAVDLENNFDLEGISSTEVALSDITREDSSKPEENRKQGTINSSKSNQTSSSLSSNVLREPLLWLKQLPNIQCSH